MGNEAIGAIGSKSNININEGNSAGSCVAYDKENWLNKKLKEGNIHDFAKQYPNALS